MLGLFYVFIICNYEKISIFALHLAKATHFRAKATWPVRLGVRTRPFHGRNTGSIPVRATTLQFSGYQGSKGNFAALAIYLV